MKKNPSARIAPRTSSALVPLRHSLPAAFGAVNVGDAATAECAASLHEEQARAGSAHRADFTGQRCLSFLGAGAAASVPLIAVSDPVIASLGIYFSMPLALSVAVLATITVAEQNKFQKASIARRREWVEETLQPRFERAQKEAYRAQKLQLIAAAEQLLGNGGRLAAEDGAWLANLDPETLAGATDQLAITALQIRKMLAHERCASFNADGSRPVAKPVGFAGQNLDPSSIQHRAYLRKQLAEEDAALAEDFYPVLQKGELMEEPELRGGVGAAIKSFLIPFYARGLRREYEKAQLPRFKDVEAQLLAPAGDFAAALERYESQNRALDLPAMRGWKSAARKSFPAPGRSI